MILKVRDNGSARINDRCVVNAARRKPVKKTIACPSGRGHNTSVEVPSTGEQLCGVCNFTIPPVNDQGVVARRPDQLGDQATRQVHVEETPEVVSGRTGDTATLGSLPESGQGTEPSNGDPAIDLGQLVSLLLMSETFSQKMVSRLIQDPVFAIKLRKSLRPLVNEETAAQIVDAVGQRINPTVEHQLPAVVETLIDEVAKRLIDEPVMKHMPEALKRHFWQMARDLIEQSVIRVTEDKIPSAVQTECKNQIPLSVADLLPIEIERRLPGELDSRVPELVGKNVVRLMSDTVSVHIVNALKGVLESGHLADEMERQLPSLVTMAMTDARSKLERQIEDATSGINQRVNELVDQHRTALSGLDELVEKKTDAVVNALRSSLVGDITSVKNDLERKVNQLVNEHTDTLAQLDKLVGDKVTADIDRFRRDLASQVAAAKTELMTTIENSLGQVEQRLMTAVETRAKQVAEVAATKRADEVLPQLAQTAATTVFDARIPGEVAREVSEILTPAALQAAVGHELTEDTLTRVIEPRILPALAHQRFRGVVQDAAGVYLSSHIEQHRGQQGMPGDNAPKWPSYVAIALSLAALLFVIFFRGCNCGSTTPVAPVAKEETSQCLKVAGAICTTEGLEIKGMTESPKLAGCKDDTVCYTPVVEKAEEPKPPKAEEPTVVPPAPVTPTATLPSCEEVWQYCETRYLYRLTSGVATEVTDDMKKKAHDSCRTNNPPGRECSVLPTP